MGEPQRQYARCKRPYMWYESIYIMFLEKADQWLPRIGTGVGMTAVAMKETSRLMKVC